MKVKVYRNKKVQKEIIRTYDRLLELWNVDKMEQDIETTYGMTHVITCGDNTKPPLVLFHGVGDDSALMWIYNAGFLSQHYRLYAIDTIGGPGKSVPGELYNKDFDDIRWIDEILDKLGIEKAFFAGVSHGGYLVQAYTLHCPQRVYKGISISGAVATGKGCAMLKIFLPEALFPTSKNVQKLIKKLSGENSAVFTENTDIMEHYTYLLRGFNNMAMSYHKIPRFSPKEVDVIRDKVEFLVGTEDPFEIMGGADELKKHRMQVTFYEKAGHGLNHELADEINAKIVEIFQKIQ